MKNIIIIFVFLCVISWLFFIDFNCGGSADKDRESKKISDIKPGGDNGGEDNAGEDDRGHNDSTDLKKCEFLAYDYKDNALRLVQFINDRLSNQENPFEVFLEEQNHKFKLFFYYQTEEERKLKLATVGTITGMSFTSEVESGDLR